MGGGWNWLRMIWYKRVTRELTEDDE
jgi:hypothetical protein